MSGLATLKSELNDFVLQTREQLQRLSQSLRAGVPGDESASLSDDGGLTKTEDPVSSESTGIDAAAVHARYLPQSGADAARAVAIHDDQPSAHHESDPMARLNAIKLRLAKQIEEH